MITRKILCVFLVAAANCLLCGGIVLGAERNIVIDLLRECREDPSCSSHTLFNELDPVDSLSISKLRQATFNDDPYVRKEAVTLLGLASDPCYRIMARLLSDDNEEVRRAAEGALAGSGKAPAQVVEALYRKERLGSPIRASILRVLRSSCDPDGLAMIHESAVSSREMGTPSQNQERIKEVSALGSCGRSSAKYLYDLLKYNFPLSMLAAEALRAMPEEESGAAFFAMALDSREGMEDRMLWARYAVKLLGVARTGSEIIDFYNAVAASESASPQLKRIAVNRRWALEEALADGKSSIDQTEVVWTYGKKSLGVSASSVEKKAAEWRRQRAREERLEEKEEPVTEQIVAGLPERAHFLLTCLCSATRWPTAFVFSGGPRVSFDQVLKRTVFHGKVGI